ncbi:MAG: alcohol dehydrogenase catalytic domain-containing protein [Candidatus Binataceae bacterium]
MSHAAAAIPAYREHPRQAMLLAPGTIELRDFKPGTPGPGEILLQVRCALSCGTDLKTWRRGHPLWKFPMAFGHEFSGVVAEVGADVEGFKPGDEVMAAPTAPCGACFFCARGQENLCEGALGRMLHGAYADLILLPAHIVARNTFIKPPELAFEEAALLEPLACVVHAHAMARPEKFETAMIIGAGAFGMLHMIALRAAGVREIAVAGRGAARLKWAAELGAECVIDVDHQDAAAETAKLCGGVGPDLVIECTGQPVGWADAFARVRRGGRVVFFGGCAPGTTLSVDTRRMHYDNLTLLAPFHYRPRDVRAAYEMLARREAGFGAVINSRRSLAQLGEVFAMLDRGEALKCAVIP